MNNTWWKSLHSYFLLPEYLLSLDTRHSAHNVHWSIMWLNRCLITVSNIITNIKSVVQYITALLDVIINQPTPWPVTSASDAVPLWPWFKSYYMRKFCLVSTCIFLDSNRDFSACQHTCLRNWVKNQSQTLFWDRVYNIFQLWTLIWFSSRTELPIFIRLKDVLALLN